MTDLAALRELTSWEEEVLAKLLSAEFEGCDELRSQARTSKARSRLGAGYSIDLMPFGDACAAHVRGTVPVEGEVLDRDGTKVHLLIHVREGFLHGLEVFKEDLSDLRELPSPKDIAVIVL